MDNSKNYLELLRSILVAIVIFLLLLQKVPNKPAVKEEQSLSQNSINIYNIQIINNYNISSNEAISDNSSESEIINENTSITATESLEESSMNFEPYYSDPIPYVEDELYMLANVIYYEAGGNEVTDRHQQLVGQVVINRMNNSHFPSSMKDVICQPGQYGCRKMAMKDHPELYDTPAYIRCMENAKLVLDGMVNCPPNVVWQAPFEQGVGIYESYKTSNGVTTYFCYSNY